MVLAISPESRKLSPIYPSPRADSGYDITDHAAVDPLYGTLEDFDELVGACHERGLELILDLVLCHTSIEHPWFRDHPDWYVWAESGPPNNWISAFGGSSWSRDPATGGWYLHSFFPEQPDLNWRNPQVEAAMHEVMRFWLRRNVDGFRLDALTALVKDAALRDEPPARSPSRCPSIPIAQRSRFGTLVTVRICCRCSPASVRSREKRCSSARWALSTAQLVP